MSTTLLTSFVAVLGIALLYALRSPPLALALAIGTYGFKQFASIVVPEFRPPSFLFNALIAIVIGASFVLGMGSRSISYCQTREGRTACTLTWGYLVFFFLSSLWSPFHDLDSNWRLFPYFLVYVITLPLMMGNPPQMLRAYRVLWFLLMLACTGGLLSEDLSTHAGRAGIVYIVMGTEFMANPFALADMGILLTLTSLLALILNQTVNSGRIFVQRVQFFSGILGIGLGLWLAFITARGETFAGIASVGFFVALAKGRNARGSLLRFVALCIIMLVILPIAYEQNYDSVVEYSPRFNRQALQEGSVSRLSLLSGSLDLGLSSAKTILVGVGARGCEEHFGMGLYPHNSIVQALVETGVVGFVWFCSCYVLTFGFGWKTLSLAKRFSNRDATIITSLSLSLLLYDLLVHCKKGSLHDPDSYMWLALSAFAFDRVKTTLLSKGGEHGSCISDHTTSSQGRLRYTMLP